MHIALKNIEKKGKVLVTGPGNNCETKNAKKQNKTKQKRNGQINK